MEAYWLRGVAHLWNLAGFGCHDGILRRPAVPARYIGQTMDGELKQYLVQLYQFLRMVQELNNTLTDSQAALVATLSAGEPDFARRYAAALVVERQSERAVAQQLAIQAIDAAIAMLHSNQMGQA